MEKFCLSYNHLVQDYFRTVDDDDEIIFNDGFYQGKKLDRFRDYDEYLDIVKNIKSIIKSDLENILNYHVLGLNNSESLAYELSILIDTIDNGIDYDSFHGNNFVFLTDNYLCFNNFENYVDELELGSLGDEAETYETIVIMDCKLKNFYFIRITKNILSVTQSTTISAFQEKDNNVKKTIVRVKDELNISELNDDGIGKLLSLLNKKDKN